MLLGLPTLLVLFENAANAGVQGGLMFAHGKGGLFFTLILPHGMLELQRGVPGRGGRAAARLVHHRPWSRGRAAGPWPRRGAASLTVALGLIVVLLVSGVIEAFVTPSPLPAWARIGIGAVRRGGVPRLRDRARPPRRGGRPDAPDMEHAPDAAPVAG